MTEQVKQPPSALNQTKKNLVPLPIMVGLIGFTILLLALSFVMVFITGTHLGIPSGDIWAQTLPSMLLLIPIHLLGIPIAFVLGSWAMNRFNHANIQRRNAVTLGFLISCVFLLWRMGINA